jgi:hypothetical protein
MLALKSVGPTVLARLEEIGFGALSQLKDQRADDITARVCDRVTSTC